MFQNDSQPRLGVLELSPRGVDDYYDQGKRTYLSKRGELDGSDDVVSLTGL